MPAKNKNSVLYFGNQFKNQMFSMLETRETI